jgi:hypothetical protein
MSTESYNYTTIEVPAPEPVDPVKSFVANVLGLAPSLNVHWEITDVWPKGDGVAPQLALAHYKDSYDPLNRMHEPLRRVRGIVVDLNTGAIVANSYGHTQALPCYEPIRESYSPSEPHGVLEIATEEVMYINSVESAPEEVPKIKPGVRKFDKATTKLFLGYEGAMIRVFKWNGQIFFSTHRRIDASRSNWGGRRSFLELYRELNGPDLNSFFGPEPYSPYCYMLLIAHDEIRLATSTRDNRIIFIGVKKVWDESVYAAPGKPYEWSGPFQVKLPTILKDLAGPFSNNHNRPMIIQPTINVDIANKFLFPQEQAKDIPTTGAGGAYEAKDHEIIIDYNEDGNAVNEIYYKRMVRPIADERLAGGDFLIMYTQTNDGKTVVYRVESPSFEYRVSITANDPNLYHRFVVEMVNFTKAEPKELADAYPPYIGAEGKPISLAGPADRQVYWWSLFYDAVAPAYKDEVDGYFNRYTEDIRRVANFILYEYPKIMEAAKQNLPANQTVTEELKRINEKTRSRIDNLRQIVYNTPRKGNISFFQILVNLLYKETGPSLYKMITTVRSLDKLKTAIESKPASS